jgi:hypothetical protein
LADNAPLIVFFYIKKMNIPLYNEFQNQFSVFDIIRTIFFFFLCFAICHMHSIGSLWLLAEKSNKYLLSRISNYIYFKFECFQVEFWIKVCHDYLNWTFKLSCLSFWPFFLAVVFSGLRRSTTSDHHYEIFKLFL